MVFLELPKYDVSYKPKANLFSENILEWATNICDKSDSLNDEELKKETDDFDNYCMGHNYGNSFYLITHERYFRMKENRFGKKIYFNDNGEIDLSIKF